MRAREYGVLPFPVHEWNKRIVSIAPAKTGALFGTRRAITGISRLYRASYQIVKQSAQELRWGLICGHFVVYKGE